MVMPKINTNHQLHSSMGSASVGADRDVDQDVAKLKLTESSRLDGANDREPATTGQFNGLELGNDAALTSADCKELEGRVDSFDHVTFWVGNARQSAVFYMTQFGFEPLAFRGLETGSRDLACHVLRLNDTIIQLVSAVEPNNRELNDFLMSHGDAVKDVAFRVENIEALLKHALENGAELVRPLEVVTFGDDTSETSSTPSKVDVDESSETGTRRLDKYIMKRATIKTFGDVTHTFIERNYDYQLARFLPGYHKPSLEVSMIDPYYKCSVSCAPLHPLFA
jgi:4-hydroxyphenylpyruvate dioxygenase